MTATSKADGGAFMGILMLDTAFPRLPGDIGNPATFDFATRRQIVSGAHPDRIVLEDASNWLPPFTRAARKLEEQGAHLITTSCGFLAPFQEALEAAVQIPVLTSSLHLYHRIAASLDAGKQVGILTISPGTLSETHLGCAAIPANTIIGGLSAESHFRCSILENRTTLDRQKSECEHVAAACAMQTEHPQLGAILLECTNMPPYAAAIAATTGLPVYSINSGLEAIWHNRPLEPVVSQP
ncbi:aspartate/glutamate racemase family protein [Salaquimonas pukyongi]|uniref:aspartate/glutamate racemase family protein n=1 Tax=Salaquimonas pukyongi TaxID=2712698 RepID=UPI00096BB3C2|nr:aspartate/glutamate racemase family protein [Salaquimonas pukyongi]